MTIDWTTIVASGLTASIITSFQFLTTRYLARLLDKIEKNTKENKEGVPSKEKR